MLIIHKMGFNTTFSYMYIMYLDHIQPLFSCSSIPVPLTLFFLPTSFYFHVSFFSLFFFSYPGSFIGVVCGSSGRPYVWECGHLTSGYTIGKVFLSPPAINLYKSSGRGGVPPSTTECRWDRCILMQVIIAVVSSRVRHPCCAQKSTSPLLPSPLV